MTSQTILVDTHGVNMTKRLSDNEWRQRELMRQMLRKRAIGMRKEGVRIVDVCAELRVSDKTVKEWEREEQNKQLTPPPYARGYLWL